MLALPLERVRGEPVRAWHVHDGELWLELPDRGVRTACACGRGHLLPTEEAGRRLLVRCHACGRCSELSLA